MPSENSSVIQVNDPVSDDEKIFKDSYDRCINLNDGDVKFVNHFYSVLKGRDSKISKLLESYPVYLQVRLVRNIIYLLADFRSSHAISPEIRNFATSHSELKPAIEPFMLALCVECLLETVAEFDPEYNSRIRAAWLAVIRPGIDYLKSVLGETLATTANHGPADVE